METISIAPHQINLFGLQVNETVLTAWCVTLGILIFSLVVRYYLVPRFKPVPTGLQSFLEFIISSINRFTASVLGHLGHTIAPYIFTLTIFLMVSGMVDLAGIRMPATDLNFTISIALITFVLIFIYAIRYRGLKGLIKEYANPVAFIAPFRVISDIIIPVSLSFRMFGNLLAGVIIVELVFHALGSMAIGIPALLQLYFTLFDVSMQTFVFIMLSLSYIKEKVE